MRERYLARLPEDQRAAARAGWTFLLAAMPGDGAAIRRVADTVGFRYTYVKERAEWAHPAALILLSAAGVVTRYVHGIEYEPAMLRASIYRAGVAEPAAAVGFLLRCYHFDPDASSHARAGVLALRFGAAGFVVILFSALGALHLSRRGKRPPAAPNGGQWAGVWAGFDGQQLGPVSKDAVLGHTFWRMQDGSDLTGTWGNFPNTCFASTHPGGANFCLCDGSVRFVSETISYSDPNVDDPAKWGTYNKLGAMADGQVLGPDW